MAWLQLNSFKIQLGIEEESCNLGLLVLKLALLDIYIYIFLFKIQFRIKETSWDTGILVWEVALLQLNSFSKSKRDLKQIRNHGILVFQVAWRYIYH